MKASDSFRMSRAKKCIKVSAAVDLIETSLQDLICHGVQLRWFNPGDVCCVVGSPAAALLHLHADRHEGRA